MARKFTRRRWRRPERMTLEAPSASRRKNLGPPDILTLETDLERQAARRRASALVSVYVVVAAIEGLVIGIPLRMIWLAPCFVVLAILYVAFVRAFGGRMLAKTLGAEAARNPRLNRYGHNLAVATGMAEPNVLIVRSDRPNAFAIGLAPHAVVATTGSLNIEDLTLEGLMAHAVVRIRDGDAALSSLYIALAGLDVLKANALTAPAAIVLLPAGLVIRALRRLWFPRDDKHRADVAAAMLTRYPPGVSTALRAAQGDKPPGPAVGAAFWFAPTDDERARLIDEM